MSKAYRCDYCHQLMRTDFGNRERFQCLPAAKGRHSGGGITFHLFVDNVPANACQPCTLLCLQGLAKSLGAEDAS